MNFLYNKRKGVPLLRGRIYMTGFCIFPVLIFRLIKLKPDFVTILSYLVLIACSYFSFMAAGVYHNTENEHEECQIYRRIDYAGIFLLIGGCGFPGCVLFMKSDFVVVTTVVHWIIIFTGVFSSLFLNLIEAPRTFKAVVYYISALPYLLLISVLFHYKYLKPFVYFVASGLLTGSGGMVYKLRKPSFIKGVFEYHELFHLLCILGVSLDVYSNLVLYKIECN